MVYAEQEGLHSLFLANAHLIFSLPELFLCWVESLFRKSRRLFPLDSMIM